MTHTTHARGPGPLVPRPYIRTWAPIRVANRFSNSPGHRGTTNQLMPHARTCVGTTAPASWIQLWRSSRKGEMICQEDANDQRANRYRPSDHDGEASDSRNANHGRVSL